MSWNQPGESRYGVHSIDHFALEVPSLGQASNFFTSFGLNVEHRGGQLELRTFGNPHIWARIYEGPRKRLAYLSLNCYADEFDTLVAQVRANDARPAPAEAYVSGEGHWFVDPDGNLIQIRIGPKTTLSALAPRVDSPPRAGQRSVHGHRDAKTVTPRRLSHVLMFSSDINRSIVFYCDVLGLRLSDRSRDLVAFMHARHGSDHHLIAFAASDAKGWHHSAWDVAGVDEVGLGAAQMCKAGYTEGWGTGRHVLGSNYFYYVRDPWGSFAEYSADIDFVPPGANWPAGDHPPEDSLYLWGPDVPPYFILNTEADAA
ncbi:VOC family protein [Ralstonia soli]|uniref:VOC family protein n=1 Tax=Ralstonia soli TaxID=2953896 RepID=A0ABT1ALA7_9RALS|nr:VOC family protein [Ralstonia soli]MCO5399064.1 VOC family protein [Ralstonia soli]